MDAYQNPSAMEPLLPTAQAGRLSELTCDILQASGRIEGQVYSPVMRQRLRDLVLEMNCYYSNLIEGHKTTPRDIEQALRQDFSSNPTQKENQLLGLAHIAVEKDMENRLEKEPQLDVCSPDFLCWLHREFYSRLPESLHGSETKGGKRYRIVPGSFRDFTVGVGSHTPPDHEALPAFMSRFQEFYGGSSLLHSARLTAIAASHHRLAWIHPFGDGNGRVIRLQSQAMLIRAGINSHGLWTLSRGLARSRERYYENLADADRQRQGSRDGRGNLSDSTLADFCVYFLETMLDQIRFMSGLLDLPALRTRVERYFQFQNPGLSRYQEEVMQVVRVLVGEGEIDRSRVQEITGRRGTVSAEIIKAGLASGLISSPSPKGPLHPAFPSEVLEFYFPRLWE